MATMNTYEIQFIKNVGGDPEANEYPLYTARLSSTTVLAGGALAATDFSTGGTAVAGKKIAVTKMECGISPHAGAIAVQGSGFPYVADADGVVLAVGAINTQSPACSVLGNGPLGTVNKKIQFGVTGGITSLDASRVYALVYYVLI